MKQERPSSFNAKAASESAQCACPRESAEPELNREEINSLPVRSYEGDVRLVRTEDDLREALSLLWKESVLGFDTETRPCFTKGKVSSPALVQLAAESCVVLVQLSHVSFGPELAELLASSRIVKAGVAIRDDMRALSKLHSFTPEGAVDLAALAKSKGFKAQGLRNLTANLLGFRISKGAQCSNWEHSALSARQIRYAATDAWVGRELYCKLHNV